jgi:hypothetical protein
MAKSVNINVSGGAAAFGAVNIGNNDTVQGTVVLTQEILDRSFDAAKKAIGETASQLQIDEKQMQAAVAQLSALKEEVQSGRKDADKGKGILKTIRENFSWAYPAIKDFAAVVWPIVLVAVGL